MKFISLVLAIALAGTGYLLISDQKRIETAEKRSETAEKELANVKRLQKQASADPLFVDGKLMAPKIAYPTRDMTREDWQSEFNEQGIAVKEISSNEQTKSYLMSIKGAEKPHIHDNHDITASIVSGKVRLNYKDRKVELEAGDVLYIPRGTYHWVENIKDDKPSEIFVVFNPPFDPADSRFVE